MAEQTTLVEPRIVISPGAEGKLAVDPSIVGQTMQELGISPDGIRNTSILVDDANRMATNGIAYPRWLGRARHIDNPQLRNAPGPIVRVSSVVKGSERSEEAMNDTLMHELEHIAQMERNDSKMKLGHIAIWGLAASGAFIANQLTRGHNKTIRSVATFAGAAVGQQIGYKIAPHEIQARKRAKEYSATAIKYR